MRGFDDFSFLVGREMFNLVFLRWTGLILCRLSAAFGDTGDESDRFELGNAIKFSIHSIYHQSWTREGIV
jgi:hypothetical protein